MFSDSTRIGISSFSGLWLSNDNNLMTCKSTSTSHCSHSVQGWFNT